MRLNSIYTAFIFSLTVLLSSAYAQTPEFIPDYVSGVTSATVADSRRFRAPKSSNELKGKLNVYVRIDERGKVISSDAVTGPGAVCSSVIRADVTALRSAGRAAASKVKFNPAVVGEIPTTSSGWLSFDLWEKKKTKSETEEEKTPDKYFAVSNSGSDSHSSNDIPASNSSGILNHKLVNRSVPIYPAAARAVRLSGPVVVQVLIDEAGLVFSAEAISGHPLLRSTSTQADCGTKFSQTLLSGEPVKVSGKITYNYVAPK